MQSLLCFNKYIRPPFAGEFYLTLCMHTTSGKAGVTKLSRKFEPNMLTFVMLIEKKSSQYQETISCRKPFLPSDCGT